MEVSSAGAFPSYLPGGEQSLPNAFPGHWCGGVRRCFLGARRTAPTRAGAMVCGLRMRSVQESCSGRGRLSGNSVQGSFSLDVLEAEMARQLACLDQQCRGGGTHCRYSCGVGPGAYGVDRPGAESLKRGLVHAQIADRGECRLLFHVLNLPGVVARDLERGAVRPDVQGWARCAIFIEFQAAGGGGWDSGGELVDGT